ncbi:hypothetical protein [Amycolatopsis azurea]|uniref:Secreted protein n=1 Tax=Amycolatopsis azurea DSM 43854 TaxID=1238180 RepID=M2PHH3_9PSEU|nr:hypothetical protein [Amycolatopsis azurea]EMD23858.1 hypothetical protein C791_6715 [Amycolatopsis azurea DSM 43854]OOC06848.1 hypothetical protein B0293_10255 [Amycolatopsis azurea DSM 43854]
MNHTPISRITKTFAVLVTGIVLAGLVPAAAVASPASPTSSEQTSVYKKKKVKLEAKADKSKVKVGEETKLKGRLDVVADDGRDAADALELIIVQKLVAGVWVDLSNGSCRPNGSFSLSLSFSVKASLTLRVYHPETTLYASATSSVFGVVVV